MLFTYQYFQFFFFIPFTLDGNVATMTLIKELTAYSVFEERIIIPIIVRFLSQLQ